MDKLRVALVHDFLVQQGGAERVLKELSDMYPEAPIFTLLYDKEKMKGLFEGKDIRPSYLQKFPNFLKKRYRFLLPFFPVIPETFDLREYDLVISSSGAWSKGIVTKLDTVHIAYLHSPMRFVWDYNERYVKETEHRRMNFLTRIVFNYLRVWDRLAADRPDFLIANSKYTQQRVDKYYRRDSKVIYPPVNQELGNRNLELEKQSKPTTYNLKPKSYFLVVSRLSPYKKVDLVVEAFNKLGLPLVVIGTGEQEKYLRKIAKENVHILGWQDDSAVSQYYQNAAAFIFPTEDDFGIAPVEAMLAGVPVIAYRKGGAQETVQEGITGEFFDAQTPEVLADGVRRFLDSKDKYDKNVIRKRGEEFSRERFRHEFGEYVNHITYNI
ncbi:MAG: Mannosyl transferase [Candidatus Moranbacteria bacterium GW2011_GWC2_37_73]|nr:MAG: Mannosyl transferase [Parcubacteria group bacterium GW2011_GWC1_36_108]KKQ00099.1 MAG: Mannosyl transferase [Candidatus Moranbacteria bacterium GW2011_GWD1_36_198]KKQ00405.1 MAG: Mannosyl transferase [Candidatus Moranbacteria bacterium GW2011_GWD2_36_198]KKQ39841.1 MAG: Mannosyl transferase [Candidatus Moranbacteria bacterium GW2011_GWC2_37_73]HAS00006.1 glycosyl transferase [Candidatus Moranbacteria bacterium]